MDIAGRRMARRRPDVTMAERGMPVRPSVPCLFFVATAGGGRRREPPPRTTRDRSDDEEPESHRSRRRNRTGRELTIAAGAGRRRGDERRAPGPTDTVGFSEPPLRSHAGRRSRAVPGRARAGRRRRVPTPDPKSGVFIRRARVELTGWLGRIFYFDVSADFAPAAPDGGVALAPSALPPTDNYVALAPFGNRLIVQVGQFDAPFTLENRTSTPTRRSSNARWSRARSACRATRKSARWRTACWATASSTTRAACSTATAPTSATSTTSPTPSDASRCHRSRAREGVFRRLSLGGSGWYGRHVLGPTFPVQATPGGVRFLAPRWTTGQPARTLELREHGYLTAFARRADDPVRHPLRPARRSGLQAAAARRDRRDAGQRSGDAARRGHVEGFAATASCGCGWPATSACCRRPGLQLPARIERRYRRAFEDGLMLADARRDSQGRPPQRPADPGQSDPRDHARRLGNGRGNYWRGSFARISINYVVNLWSGTSETIKALRAQGLLEHELLLRFATSL